MSLRFFLPSHWWEQEFEVTYWQSSLIFVADVGDGPNSKEMWLNASANCERPTDLLDIAYRDAMSTVNIEEDHWFFLSCAFIVKHKQNILGIAPVIGKWRSFLWRDKFSSSANHEQFCSVWIYLSRANCLPREEAEYKSFYNHTRTHILHTRSRTQN